MSTVQQADQPTAAKVRPLKNVVCAGGVGAALFPATIQTKDGPKQVFNVAICHPRYQTQSGEWKDAPLRPEHLPGLIFALERIRDHCFSTPVAGPDENEGEVPF